MDMSAHIGGIVTTIFLTICLLGVSELLFKPAMLFCGRIALALLIVAIAIVFVLRCAARSLILLADLFCAPFRRSKRK